MLIDYRKFKEEFLQTEIGKQIARDFDIVSCDDDKYTSINILTNNTQLSCPREVLGTRERFYNKQNYLSIVPFYYILFLLEKKPDIIVDVGCGWNIFKKYIPNIHGIDTIGKYCDEQAEFNLDWIQANRERFPSAFSVNLGSTIDGSRLLNIENLADQIKQFAKIIKPGGRGFISTSGFFVMKNTQDAVFEKYSLSRNNPEEVKEFIKRMVLSLPFKILCVDIELDLYKLLPSHDGEIRVVFEIP